MTPTGAAMSDDDDDLFEDATEGEMEVDEQPQQTQSQAEEKQPDENNNNDANDDDKSMEIDNGTSNDVGNEVVEIKEEPRDDDSQVADFQMQTDLNENSDPDRFKTSFRLRNPISPVEGASNCSNYIITPYVACLHASPVYCVDFSWGLNWMFTGGADGFIRRYNFFDSVNGKLPLTVAQKHPFVDTVTKSGVLNSYWENEQPVLEKDIKLGKDGMYEPKVSPVYSLAVQSEALWCLGGLESGGINLQTVRHNEGQIQAYFNKHKSAVSVLKLDANETRAISGSWDKTLVEWDLNSCKYTREFIGAQGQISAMEFQPVGGSLIDSKLAEKKPVVEKDDDEKSLDSLFGDDDEDEDGNDNNNNNNNNDDASKDKDNDDAESQSAKNEPKKTVETSESVFMSACIDGTVDIWDRRQETKAGHLYVPEGTPPWAMSACWSTDGNSIFVGRRNHAVEEYDIRKSLTKPSRTMKFPSVSGAVSTVCAMPSGRHILCGSQDNLRLYDLKASETKSKTPFFIVPGHHGGVLSTVYVDPSCQYLVTASGSRGWQQGASTDVALVYEIRPE